MRIGRKELTVVGSVALLICFSLLLGGCTDIYKETCVWHSDLLINGCDYYGFRECIRHCHYCIKENGPDECGQLQCASYCAKRKGDDSCLSNFKTLCEYAMEEQPHLSGCAVDCSASPQSAKWSVGALFFILLSHVLFADFSSPLPEIVTKRLPMVGMIAVVIVVSLSGCCEDPEKQLEWAPDYEEFKKKADWYTEDGIWRGNPTWNFYPMHEAEGYECKMQHRDRPICLVWTVHEWNCDEQAFGVCKCDQIHPDSNYCKRWGCHSLEADQHICSNNNNDNNDGNSGESCSYNEFKMDEQRYSELVARQDGGDLTTGEHWWSFSNPWRRRLEEAPGNDFLASQRETNASIGLGNAIRRLADDDGFPPPSAYMPQSRWQYYNYDGVCIANGDNVQLVRRKCDRWREVETEIAQCHCKKGSGGACLEWYCEERDVGLFSVLFRTKKPINHLVTGTEQENYTCVAFDQGGGCSIWEGIIHSVEEVEWTRCECEGGSCQNGGGWKCDEYELRKTRDLFFEEYRGKWFWFIFFEVGFCCMIGRGGCLDPADKDDAYPVLLCMNCCMGICIFPFLMVTFGVPGFLLLGLPFWALRCCICACMCCIAAPKPDFSPPAFSGEATQENFQPDAVQPVLSRERSSKERFKRGASAIIGRRQA